MTRRTFAFIFIALAALSDQAHAAFYQFTMDGRITFALDPRGGAVRALRHEPPPLVDGSCSPLRRDA
jgi:hypothetical protein